MIRVAIAGVSLDFALGSAAVGSSVSIGARESPSRPMPSSSPCAEGSTPTDRASESARGETQRILVKHEKIWRLTIVMGKKNNRNEKHAKREVLEFKVEKKKKTDKQRFIGKDLCRITMGQCFFTGSPASTSRHAAGGFFFFGHQFLHVSLAEFTARRETDEKTKKQNQMSSMLWKKGHSSSTKLFLKDPKQGPDF